MEITSRKYQNILDEDTANVVQNITPQSFSTFFSNDFEVIENYFDSFGNFIFQSKVKGINYDYEYNDESNFYNYLKTRIGSRGLNKNGTYTINYFIVKDIFKSYNNPTNKFIVTEISSDRTEVRLNPLSNNDTFIEKFNRFKNYKKEAPDFIDVAQLDSHIKNSLESYINNFLSENNVERIVNNLTVTSPIDGEQITIRQFLSDYYAIEEVNNNIQSLIISLKNIKNRVSDTFFNEVFEPDLSLKELKDNFYSNPNTQNLQKIEDRIYELFLSNISKLVLQFIDIDLSGEIRDDGPGDGDTGGGSGGSGGTEYDDCEILKQNYNPIEVGKDAINCDGTTYYWDRLQGIWTVFGNFDLNSRGSRRRRRPFGRRGNGVGNDGSGGSGGTTYPPIGRLGESNGEEVIYEGVRYIWDESSQTWTRFEETDLSVNGGGYTDCQIYTQGITPAEAGKNVIECNGKTYSWSDDAGEWIFQDTTPPSSGTNGNGTSTAGGGSGGGGDTGGGGNSSDGCRILTNNTPPSQIGGQMTISCVDKQYMWDENELKWLELTSPTSGGGPGGVDDTATVVVGPGGTTLNVQ